MALIGYAQNSTFDKDFPLQMEELITAGCHKVFTEKLSGTKREGRQVFNECLNTLRDGDTLVVTRIDHLSNSLYNLKMLVHYLDELNIKIKVTELEIDTSSASGKIFMDILDVCVEFDIRERNKNQLESTSHLKWEASIKKSTAQINVRQVIELTMAGLTRDTVALQLKIGRSSVYRILKAYRLQNPDVIFPGERVRPSIVVIDNSKEFDT